MSGHASISLLSLYTRTLWRAKLVVFLEQHDHGFGVFSGFDCFSQWVQYMPTAAGSCFTQGVGPVVEREKGHVRG